MLIIIALEIEKFGQVKDLIISITSLMVVPLLAPSLWGLFSRRINGRAVWITGLSGFCLGAIIRFGFGKNGWFEGMTSINDWVVSNTHFLKTFVGVIFPVIVLSTIELMSRGESEGWKKIAALSKQQDETEHQGTAGANPIAAKVVAWCLMVCALMMFSLIAVNESESTVVLSVFGATLAVISCIILFFCRKSAPSNKF